VAEPIRFYLDEHYPHPVSQGLRRHGVDVLTTQEARRCGSADVDQLAFSSVNNRVLVSFDADYLALHRSGVAHAGIAWCQEQKHTVGQLIQALLLLHGVLDANSMRNHVEYL
jgi:predicted nuclease of predicted toxin-antitoxin system